MNVRYWAAVAAVSLGAAGFGSQASASEVAIGGAIFWGAGTPTTPFSQSGDISVFSFDLDSSLPHTFGASTATTITDASYTLENVTVNVPIASVTFYSAGIGGGFDINFGGAYTGDVVSLYTAALGNVGTTWEVGPSGSYSATAAYDDGAATSLGNVVVSVSAVPLPAALPLFGAAIVGMAGLGVRKSRRAAA